MKQKLSPQMFSEYLLKNSRSHPDDSADTIDGVLSIYENQRQDLRVENFLDYPKYRRELSIKFYSEKIKELLPLIEAMPPGKRTINNADYDAIRRYVLSLYRLTKKKHRDAELRLRKLRFEERIMYCGSKAHVACSCGRCSSHHKDVDTVVRCQNRYDSCCATMRYRKYYARFMVLKKRIRSPKLIHSVIGFPHIKEYKRSEKKGMEHAINIFLRKLRKAGIYFRGKKVMDIADPEFPFVHFHLALLPMHKAHDLRRIQRIVKQATKETIPFVYHYIGYRNVNGLFDYFAKRQAGLYGHVDSNGNGKYVQYRLKTGEIRRLYYQFSPKDLLGVDDYLSEFYNIRTLTNVSRGIGSTIVPVSEFKCQICEYTKQKVAITIEYSEFNDNRGVVT